MKKWLSAGTALLLIQITMALLFHLNARDFGAFTPHLKFLDFTPAEVDTITIRGPEKELVLKQINREWRLPDYFAAPADQELVTAILAKLVDLKQGMVVATSEEAAGRFKVSDDDFARHLTLTKGEATLADFYLGTSPGFKMIHARVKGNRDIITVPLNSYELEADPEKWLDRGMLQIDENSISRVVLGDIELHREGDSWRLADPAAGEVDQARVKNLLGRIANLMVKAILDPAATNSATDPGPELLLTITLNDNSERIYSFIKPADQDYSILKSSTSGYLFKIDNWLVDEIGKQNKSSLLGEGAD